MGTTSIPIAVGLILMMYPPRAGPGAHRPRGRQGLRRGLPGPTDLDLARIQKRLKGREPQARQVLVRLAAIATMVPPDLLGDVRIVEGDPDDDVLFATALAAGARTIVSGDAAVLAVGGFAGVAVVSASEFLATLGESSPPGSPP